MGIFDFLKRKPEPISLFRNYGGNNSTQKQIIETGYYYSQASTFLGAPTGEVFGNFNTVPYPTGADGILKEITIEGRDPAAGNAIISYISKLGITFSLFVNNSEVLKRMPIYNFPILEPYKIDVPFLKTDLIQWSLISSSATFYTIDMNIFGIYTSAKI